MLAVAVAVPLGLWSAGFLFELTAREVPMSAAEKEALVQVGQVADLLADYEPDPAKATFTKRRYLDGSFELHYSFDDLDGGGIFVQTFVAVERNRMEAMTGYAALIAGETLGWQMQEGVTRAERDDIFRWGDSSRCTLLECDGEPFGQQFHCRSGRHIYVLTLSGVCFDEPGVLEDLLTPCLERACRLRP